MSTDVVQEFTKVHKNTGEKIFAKYLSADGCFVKTIIVLTVMITAMLSKLKINLYIAPDRNELLQIIETMQKFSLFSKDGAVVQSHVNHAARIIEQHFAEKSRQTTIRDYFRSL